MEEIERDAASNGWYRFENEILHSRGFPKLMRGDTRWSGNALQFRFVAAEFLDRLNLQGRN